MNQPLLTVKDLHKSYKDNKAVDGISFEIARGEIFGLLGPNGAGKSTTISMLAGLTKADAGEISLNGKKMGPFAYGLKSKIGFVPQEIALYATLSAHDNLMFFGQIYGLGGKQLHERVSAVLEMVGLADRAKDAIETYSGGMKRRINIAAGLLHEPEILFLDEPTVGVDPQSRNAIFESVQKLNKEGLTILYTTHYMEEAENLCQRIGIIDRGTIIAMDSPKGLIRGLGGGLLKMSFYNGKTEEVSLEAEKLAATKDIWRQDQQLVIQTHEANEALLGVLEITNRLDAQVTSLQILEPNLETVFLQLTGKSLRD